MLIPNNVPAAWGEAFKLSDEFTDSAGGNSPDSNHPPSFFIHNEDDPGAPIQGTLAYHAKLLSVGAPMSSLHVTPEGGHGFGLCETMRGNYKEVCDYPKYLQRFLQTHGFAPGLPADHIPGPLLEDMMTQNCA